MLLYVRDESQLDSYVPSQLSGLAVINHHLSGIFDHAISIEKIGISRVRLTTDRG